MIQYSANCNFQLSCLLPNPHCRTSSPPCTIYTGVGFDISLVQQTLPIHQINYTYTITYCYFQIHIAKHLLHLVLHILEYDLIQHWYNRRYLYIKDITYEEMI